MAMNISDSKIPIGAEFKLKLRKCPGCKQYPFLYSGKEGLTNKNVFVIMCVNKDCKRQPSTGNCSNKHKAADQWNTGMVSDSLFLVDRK
jgi:hypothetical protein